MIGWMRVCERPRGGGGSMFACERRGQQQGWDDTTGGVLQYPPLYPNPTHYPLLP